MADTLMDALDGDASQCSPRSLAIDAEKLVKTLLEWVSVPGIARERPGS